MITVIPDIHADLDRLKASLAVARGVRPAFLGDFIDAGSNPGTRLDDRAVLERVRPLVDRGEALAVMGNHELNAILYHRRGSDGEWLRKHSDKNESQHRSFLKAFGDDSPEALSWTDWFLDALPLWHEGDGFRLVHAVWSDADIALIRARRPDARLRPEDLQEVAGKVTPFAKAVGRITSGHEATLPPGYSFRDKGGAERREVRLSWWRAGRTWPEVTLSVPDVSGLPEGQLPEGILPHPYPDTAAPVFVGHYKMTGAPKIEAPRVICLDYPETACVYHWRGEMALRAEHLEHIGI